MNPDFVRPPAIITDAAARAAYKRLGEPVPANLRKRLPWPQAAAVILGLSAAGYVAAGVATNVFAAVFS